MSGKWAPGPNTTGGDGDCAPYVTVTVFDAMPRALFAASCGVTAMLYVTAGDGAGGLRKGCPPIAGMVNHVMCPGCGAGADSPLKTTEPSFVTCQVPPVA